MSLHKVLDRDITTCHCPHLALYTWLKLWVRCSWLRKQLHAIWSLLRYDQSSTLGNSLASTMGLLQDKTRMTALTSCSLLGKKIVRKLETLGRHP